MRLLLSPRSRAKHSSIRLRLMEQRGRGKLTHQQNDNIEKVKDAYYTNGMVSQRQSPRAIAIPIIEKAWVISECRLVKRYEYVMNAPSKIIR
jgi:hypothetical protein